MSDLDQLVEGFIAELGRDPLLDNFDKVQLCSRLEDKFREAHNMFMDLWERQLDKRFQDEDDAA